MPGTCMSQVSSDWECCAALPPPAPTLDRSTIGTCAWPPNMYRNFAAWLTSGSIANGRKSPYINSTTGRIPVAAAPTPTATMPSSEIGLSRTLDGPNSLAKPSVTPNTPPPSPQTPISSPSRKTLRSRIISSRNASFKAAEYVMSLSLGIQVFPHRLRIRKRTRFGKLYRLTYFVFGLLFETGCSTVGQDAGLNQASPPIRNRIFAAPENEFIFRTIFQTVSKKVAFEAIAQSFHKCWSQPISRSFYRR